MNWIKRCKLLAVEAIQYNSCLCNKLEDLYVIRRVYGQTLARVRVSQT